MGRTATVELTPAEMRMAAEMGITRQISNLMKAAAASLRWRSISTAIGVATSSN
jgi:hypothetical protein